MIADAERKLHHLLDQVVRERAKNKWPLTVRRRKALLSVREKKRTRSEVRIGDVDMKQVLGSVISENGTYDAEVRKRFRCAKDEYQKLKPVLRHMRISLEKNKIKEC